MRRVSATTVEVETAIIITYFECVSVVFGIQHAMCMHSLACPALQYFSTLSHKPARLLEKKKIIEHKMCFDFLHKFFLKYFSF